MTEAQTSNNQVLNSAGTANRVVPKKTVYMRSREMVEFEKEIETSRLAAENATNKPSESAPEPEKPTSTDEPQTDWQKRYTDLQSDRDKKLSEANKKLTEANQKNLDLENKLKDAGSNKPKYPTSEAELEQWCKEFPPLVPIIQTLALKSVEGEFGERVKELEQFSKAYANEKGRLELLQIHPDANEVETDPRFAQWYSEQEPEIQKLIDGGSPKKIAKAITLYKKDLGIVTKTVQDLQKEASKAVTLGQTPPSLPQEQRTWYESEVNKMTNKQYAHYEKEIEKARIEGRYVYDLTR